MRRKWLTRAATLALLGLIGLLVVDQLRALDWREVSRSLAGYGFASLAVAFALALPAQLACAAFDLVGRHATGHRLPVGRVMLISFTGYYFSLNLGALVGGLAFRYRLYVPHRFSAMTISQIIGLSVLTNWSGYVLIAGIVLAWKPPALPADWDPSTAALRGIGVGFLAVAAAYLWLCARHGGMQVNLRGTLTRLPNLRVAAMQLALSLVSWGSIGAVLTWVMPGDIGWFTVMPVLMVSAIAGIWSHVPGGLGVIEAVFLAMLGERVGRNELLAAVLVFRAVYYLVPFAVAALAYLWLEATARSVPESEPRRVPPA